MRRNGRCSAKMQQSSSLRFKNWELYNVRTAILTEARMTFQGRRNRMNDEQYAFFRELVETTGPSGYEQQAQQRWRERVQGVASSIATDSLGSVIACLNPS